jgi:hypothetical protein
MNLLKTSIQIRAHELSKKQAEVAKQLRKSRQQPMSGLVEQIVSQEPGISQHQLSQALKRMLVTMDDPPYSHSGGSFKSRDKKFPDISNDALKYNDLYAEGFEPVARGRRLNKAMIWSSLVYVTGLFCFLMTK